MKDTGMVHFLVFMSYHAEPLANSQGFKAKDPPYLLLEQLNC